MKSKLKLPDWTKNLPNKALINAKDMAKISGYKDVHCAVNQGSLPKPSHRFDGGRNKGMMMWKLGDLRKAEKEQLDD
jgi:hypothetical protein